MEDFKYCKIEIFVPRSHFNEICEALKKHDVGHIGKYDSCLSYSEVSSRWRPLEGSNPYNGKEGVITEEKELKIEATCYKDVVKSLVEDLKEVHPYEEAVINVIPLYEVGL